MKNILLTGCAGFIGANFVKTICLDTKVKSEYKFHIVDALTYAGNYGTIESDINNHEHLSFQHLDLRDEKGVNKLFADYSFDGVIHFAAESHVDRSIENPNVFVETNVMGTLNLLNCSRREHEKNADFRYLQVSTDEVYGTLTLDDPAFSETTPLAPNSPYSASKTSGDLLVRAFAETYGMTTLITRCSNNYGPYQFPEKLLPLMINNAKEGKPLPVYGKGENIRDWIYVDDHNQGVWDVYTKGRAGEVYNLGGNAEMVNIDIVKMIVRLMGKSENLITYVEDRKGHDFRYAMDYSKIEKEMKWTPKVKFEEGLKKTISWYLENQDWVNSVS